MSKTKYKAIKVDGIKYDYHRWLMEQTIGRKLNSDEFVHHIDGNKLNNDINNLEIISRSDHGRLHQTGKTLSDKTRQKLSEVHMGLPNRTQRKLSDEQVEYIRDHYIPRDKEFGVRSLAKRFGISHSRVSDIINGKRYKNPL